MNENQNWVRRVACRIRGWTSCGLDQTAVPTTTFLFFVVVLTPGVLRRIQKVVLLLYMYHAATSVEVTSHKTPLQYCLLFYWSSRDWKRESKRNLAGGLWPRLWSCTEFSNRSRTSLCEAKSLVYDVPLRQRCLTYTIVKITSTRNHNLMTFELKNYLGKHPHSRHCCGNKLGGVRLKRNSTKQWLQFLLLLVKNVRSIPNSNPLQQQSFQALEVAVNCGRRQKTFFKPQGIQASIKDKTQQFSTVSCCSSCGRVSWGSGPTYI